MSTTQRKPSFEEIYAEYADRIYRYCYRLCGGNAADAEDLVQETFLRVYRGLDRFEGRSSVLTWLYRIALHEWMRRPKALEALAVTDEIEAPAPDDSSERLMQLAIQRALERLPESLRQALILVKAEGLTHREAALVLGVPQGTVQFRVHEALKRMRRLLSDERAGGTAALALPAGALERHLREWGNVATPATLALRVYSALEALPPAGAPPPLSSPPAAARLPAGPGASTGPAGLPAGRTLGLAAGAAVLLLLLAGGLLHFRPRPQGAAALLRSTLESMREVQTAHAIGTHIVYPQPGDPVSTVRRMPVEFWFKAPGRYRRSFPEIRGRQGFAPPELIVEGGRAIMLRPRLGARAVGTIVLPASAHDAMNAFAPFAFFTADAYLPNSVEAGAARVTAVPGEFGDRDVQIVTAERRTIDRGERWTLVIEPSQRTVLRVEYLFEQTVDGIWRPAWGVTLDRIEYDRDVPDALFRLPAAG